MKTFGTIRLGSQKGIPSWAINCEPHVKIRLKRVFGKVDRHGVGELWISNTPENCRDLEWFLARYPMEIEPADALTRGADVQRETEAMVFRLLDGTYAPPSFDLAVPLREYQKIPPAMMLQTGGLLCADDVGLGKTAEAIAAFADARTLPALVVTLTHLPRQWKAEIARFAPKLSVMIAATGTPKYETKDAQASMFSRWPDVLILNYHKLAGWADTLLPIIKTVIYDEAHELRRPGSAKYSAALRVSSSVKYRMGLTATPIFNYGSEIFPVMDAIHPGALGHQDEFVREWCAGGLDSKGRARIKDPKAFGAYARNQGLMLRRTRHDVGRELPALTKVPHYVDADLSAIDSVSESVAELARVILRQGESRRGEKMQASEEFNNALRQATGIAKAPFVADFVRLLVESGERVLVFGWHREVYRVWFEKLKDLNPVMFTGSESATQKESARQRFLAGESPVMFMSLRSGAGIDGLQKVCRTVVFGELDWAAGVHEQCAGRVHRDGQPDPVMAYYLISDFGADPIMVDVLGIKGQQLSAIRDPYAAAVEQAPAAGDHVRRLAEHFLRERGLAVPQQPEVAA